MSCLLPLTPVAAQELSNNNISADVSVASDYRFRGYSRSGGDPAVDANLDVTLPLDQVTSVFSGTTGTLFPENSRYGSAELDLYGGLQRNLGAIRLAAGARGYFFANGSAPNYYEVFGSGSADYGPLSARLGLAVAPERTDYGNGRRVYVYTDLNGGIPRTPFTLGAHFGRETANGVPEKLDWSLTTTYVHSPMTVSLSYVARSRVVPSDFGLNKASVARAALLLKLGASF